MFIRIRVSHASPLVAHLKWPPWMIKRGCLAKRTATVGQIFWTNLASPSWKIAVDQIVAPMVEICWDAQKRTLTLEYHRNLPEYQPPCYHLAYVTASNYLWTLYIYIYIYMYISIMKAFLFSLVKYTNLQIMMNMMNMTRSSIEYKSPFWLFKSPFFLVESC